MIMRSDERSTAPGLASAKRRTSAQIVGTAPENVGRSSLMKRESGSAWRNCAGMRKSAPAIQHEYGSPHAFAWNIGTIGSTRSWSLIPRPPAEHAAKEWSTVERCV